MSGKRQRLRVSERTRKRWRGGAAIFLTGKKLARAEIIYKRGGRGRRKTVGLDSFLTAGRGHNLKFIITVMAL